jgi:fructose-1,6-bisphosphatase/sedoheptulose 1,7-bisphosphatase-like protein
LTLEYLKEVRDRRVAYGKEMMAGIGGAEGVVAAAAGRAIEGEAVLVTESVAARKQFEREMGEEMDTDGEVEFEDAVDF